MTAAANSAVVRAQGQHLYTVIFLHGLGDTGHGWAEVCKQEWKNKNTKFICPHAPERAMQRFGGQVVSGWYDRHEKNGKVVVTGMQESTDMVHKLIDEEILSGILPNRILVGGFSMGGGLAIYSTVTYPKRLAGIVSLSAKPIWLEKLPGKHESNLNTPLFVAHGTRDTVVAPSFAEEIRTKISSFNPNVEYKIYEGLAHNSSRQELAEAQEFMNNCFSKA